MFYENLFLASVAHSMGWGVTSHAAVLETSGNFVLILSGAAMADTCNSFATYTCAKGVHNGAFIGGAGTLIAAPGAGLLLSGNAFTVSTHNGSGGADVIILAASASGTPTGTLDGIAFNSLNTFPEGGATGAIVTNLHKRRASVDRAAICRLLTLTWVKRCPPTAALPSPPAESGQGQRFTPKC